MAISSGGGGGGGVVLKMHVSAKVYSIIWTTTSEFNMQSFLQSMQLIILMSVQPVTIVCLKDNTHCLCCHNCCLSLL